MRTLADYTANDVVPEERPHYAAHVERWQMQLHPTGELECWFAAEIVRAVWRLQQYAPLGPDLAIPGQSNDEARAAWLRYRERTSAGIRRNLEELRRIQSDRYLQSHLGILLPGVASLKSILPGLKLAQRQPEPQPATEAEQQDVVDNADPASVAYSEGVLSAKIQQEECRQLAEYTRRQSATTPETKPVQPVASTPPVAAPRNAPCPCNSGRKYKHCCGHWSKTPLPKAA